MYNWFQAALPHFIAAAQVNSNTTLGPALGFKNPAACTRFFNQFLPDRPQSIDTCTYLVSLAAQVPTKVDQIGSELTRKVRGKEYVYALDCEGKITFVRPLESDPDYDDRIQYYKKDLGLHPLDDLPA